MTDDEMQDKAEEVLERVDEIIADPVSLDDAIAFVDWLVGDLQARLAGMQADAAG